MNEFFNRHYITVDDSSRITAGWSDGPHRERDTAGAICISEQGGYQFRLFPGGEENPPLRTMDGVPLYKWDGEQVLPRTEDEIAADRAALPEPDKPVDLAAENKLLREQIAACANRQEFLEDCIAEMAVQVYGA